MQDNYTFYVPPVFDEYDGIRRNYNQRLLQLAESSRRDYITLLETLDRATAFEQATHGIFELFITSG